MAPVLSQSTLLRLHVPLKGNCPKHALGCMHFPDLSCSSSGSWVLHKGTDSVGSVFCALPRSRSSGDQVLGRRTTLGVCISSPPQSQLLSFLGAPQERHLSCAMSLLWGSDLRLRPSLQMATVQDPRKMWLATGSLLTVWWRMPSLGPRFSLAFCLWLSPTCPSTTSGRGMGQATAS